MQYMHFHFIAKNVQVANSFTDQKKITVGLLNYLSAEYSSNFNVQKIKAQ